MAEYGEGYTEPLDGSSSAFPAEERHDVGGSKRGSKDSDTKPKRKRSCPMYFGVKSYLHQFYEDHTYKDPALYEDDDHQCLLQRQQRRQRCIWWKLFMWIGVILLLFGVMGILIGYLVPPRHVLIESPDDLRGDAYIDEKAQEYNTTLDMCKLIGLILFCIGGVTLALSLLFPSFLTRYCDDDANSDFPPLPAHLQHEDMKRGPMNPLQEVIPVSSTVKGVQPTKKAAQQMLTHTTPPSNK